MGVTTVEEAEGGSRLPRGSRTFLSGLVLAVAACGGIELLCRTVLGLNREPYNFPLLREYFPDLVFFIPRFRFFHSAEFFSFANSYPFMYPAPVAVVYRMFLLSPYPVAAYLGFGLAALGGGGALLGFLLMQRGVRARSAWGYVGGVLVCSYPIWFALKQANMEVVIWAIVSAGLVLFLRGRGYSAAVCFGVATSMKIFPLVYFGLLLVRRQYRQIALGACVAAGATVGGLWLVGPDLATAAAGISKGIATFRSMIMLARVPEIAFDHSLFALFKMLLRPLPPPAAVGHLLSLYLAVAAVGGVALFFLRIRHLPLLNQIFCLTIASILLPPTSFEYTLLHLFVPLGLMSLLLVDLRRTGQRVAGTRPALVCVGLLLAFLPEIIVRGQRIEGQVKCVVLVALFVLVLRRPMPMPDSRAEAFDLSLARAERG